LVGDLSGGFECSSSVSDMLGVLFAQRILLAQGNDAEQGQNIGHIWRIIVLLGNLAVQRQTGSEKLDLEKNINFFQRFVETFTLLCYSVRNL